MCVSPTEKFTYWNPSPNVTVFRHGDSGREGIQSSGMSMNGVGTLLKRGHSSFHYVRIPEKWGFCNPEGSPHQNLKCCHPGLSSEAAQLWEVTATFSAVCRNSSPDRLSWWPSWIYFSVSLHLSVSLCAAHRHPAPSPGHTDGWAASRPSPPPVLIPSRVEAQEKRPNLSSWASSLSLCWLLVLLPSLTILCLPL